LTLFLKKGIIKKERRFFMKGVAWKNSRVATDNFVYILQVDEIKGVRQQNKLLKDVVGWDCTGNVYDPKSKTESLLFKRNFRTETEWKAWARKFPYVLEEITEMTGRPKPYKLGLDYQQKTRGRKANAC
tara:strand:- start:647 stop:1033 length:387 start_codon:yes stop_codon:yes gene_type:complete